MKKKTLTPRLPAMRAGRDKAAKGKRTSLLVRTWETITRSTLTARHPSNSWIRADAPGAESVFIGLPRGFPALALEAPK
jgi:hypothetical protein